MQERQATGQQPSTSRGGGGGGRDNNNNELERGRGGCGAPTIAEAAPPPPPSPSATASASASASCHRCVVLLRHVLSQTESLPHQLLQSLTVNHHDHGRPDATAAAARSASATTHSDSSSSMLSESASSPRYQQQQQEHQLVTRPVDGGIQVRIPAEDPAAVRRTWRDLLQPHHREEEAVEAKAAVPATTITTATGATLSNNDGDVGPRTSTDLPPPPSSSSSSASPQPPLLHRLATSPSRTAAEQRSPPDGNASSKTRHEWLTFTCRHCSDVGPEGGARAFVMGPDPLSVVVCHNRLLPERRPTRGQEEPQQQQHHDPSGAAASPSPLYSPTPSFLFSSSTSKLASPGPASSRLPTTPGGAPPTEASPRFSAAHVDEMNEILSHELSHVYDVRRLMLDLRDCENLAYSEVRAARIAECRSHRGNGEGGGGSEQGDGSPATSLGAGGGFARGWYLPSYYGSQSAGAGIGANGAAATMHQQRSCVRQKAVTATLNLFPHQARSCLNQVFEAAMADHRPLLRPLPMPRTSHTGPTAAGGGGGAPARSSAPAPPSTLLFAAAHGVFRGSTGSSKEPSPSRSAPVQEEAPSRRGGAANPTSHR